MQRRDFLKAAGLAAAATLAGAGPAMAGQKQKVLWRMAAPWGPHRKLFRSGADRLAKRVSLLTQSRLAIGIRMAQGRYDANGLVRAVTSGEVDCVHAPPSMFSSLAPFMDWFEGVPFGLNPAGTDAWLYQGGGLDLWREMCRPLGLVPLPLGDLGPCGPGWATRPLDTKHDLAGLRASASGLAGRVLAAAGAAPVPSDPLSEAGRDLDLATGTVDLEQGLDPLGDLDLGLGRTARHHLDDSCFLPSRRMALFVNRKAYNAAHPVLRRILDCAAAEEDLKFRARVAWDKITAAKRLEAGEGATPSRLGPKARAALEGAARKLVSETAPDADFDKVRRHYFKTLSALKPHQGRPGCRKKTSGDRRQ